ncbi:TonB-dependent receptor, partial [Balneolaceae bacterium ANBcel3]|nr:TonB-dependent receptor [Balneolaceae bacterium ANBcel3]
MKPCVLLFLFLAIWFVQMSVASDTGGAHRSLSLEELEASDRRGTLVGSVEDRQTAEPLTGVHIVLQNGKIEDGEDDSAERSEESFMGVASGIDGRFTLEGIPAGIYVVKVTSLGYETALFTDVVIRPARETRLTIRLNETIYEGNELVVRSGFFQRRDDQPVSYTTFNPEEIRRAPGGGQEVARMIELLPSVASDGEMSQDLMVRGGSPIENVFIIDNIPMPGIQHFRMQNGRSNGPIGIINTDLVSEIEFQSGGFGAMYGNGMSSVTNIRYREGTRSGFNGDVMMSMAGFGGTVEHGLSDGRGSVFVSGRRSYLDLLAEAINAGGAPRYSDIQAKMVYDIHPAHQITFLNIAGSGTFSSDEDDALDSGVDETYHVRMDQNTTGINLRTLWSRNLFSNTSVSWSVSREESDIFDMVREDYSHKMEYTQHMFTVRNVSSWQVSQGVRIQFGTDLKYESGQYDYYSSPTLSLSGRDIPEVRRDLTLSGFLGSGFISAGIRPVQRAHINVGLRADYTGYNEDLDLSPRVSMRYQLTSRWALSGAWGVFRQQNNRYLMSQSESNQKLVNPKAIHYVAGIEYLLTPETLVSLEVFEKRYRNMPQLPAGTENGYPGWVFDNTYGYFVDLESDGIGWARGIEFFLQKKLARGFYGAISASGFRTRYRDFQGAWHDRKYDIQYMFAVNGGYRPNNRREVSARWSYQGGNPYTPFDVEASIMAGSGLYDMTHFNDSRTRAFHALYVRYDRRFFYSRTNLVTFIELWNAYNRQNEFRYYWSTVDQETKVTNQFSIIPVGGVRFEF